MEKPLRTSTQTRPHVGLHAAAASEKAAGADADIALEDLDQAVAAFCRLSSAADVDERRSARAHYILKKQLARACISSLLTEPHAMHVREARASALISRFRTADNQLRVALAEAGAISVGLGTRPPRFVNILDEARATTDRSSVLLQGGLKSVSDSLLVARESASELAENREKMKKISDGLDEASSELAISKRLIVQFSKRLFTDRIFLILLLTFIVAAVGLAIYIGLDPVRAARAFAPANVLPPANEISPSVVTKETLAAASMKDPMDGLRAYRAPSVRGPPPR
jgi:hypothetical protein